jgi:ribosomal peptide maturation radical SAM protein 1
MSPPKRVCLVSMPFVPVNMPGMGVSTLKAALARDGIACDIYYGALEFLKFFSDEAPIRELRLDYDYVATNMHVGEIQFASALWEDARSDGWIELVIERLTTTPNHVLSTRQMDHMAVRLRRYAARTRDFIDCCYAARDWASYDIVGFSSTFSQNVASLTLAKRIRARHPRLCIVFGGANCESVMGEQLLRSFQQVDYVIGGEADFAFPKFVAQWRRGEAVTDVPGIVYRRGADVVVGAEPAPVAEMDSLPIPEFDDFFAQLPEDSTADGLRANVVLPIETSRGCWWGAVKHCIFCGLNPTTMQYRSKSGERALREFRELRARYNETHFYAVDNILNRRYFRDVLPMLRVEGLDIFYETKSNLRESEVATLAAAGVRQLQPGIEGLSSVILALMKKGVKGYQNIETLKWCAIHGIDVTWSYLYGFPNEPAEPYFDAARMMPLLHHLPPPGNANPILLDRYSPMYTQRDAYGLRNVRPTAASRIYYSGLSEEEAGNLSYHFDMDLPQGNVGPYSDALRKAILEWKHEYLRGARFYQFESPHATLLIDTRSVGMRSFLLEGAGARVYRALRKAEPLRAVFAALAADGDRDDAGVLAGDAMILAQVALYLGSEVLAAPTSEEEARSFLHELLRLGLVLAIDGLFIALAIDCTTEDEAAPLGLAEFVVRHPEGGQARPVAGSPLETEDALVQ